MSRAGALPSSRSQQPKPGGSQEPRTAGSGGTVTVSGVPAAERQRAAVVDEHHIAARHAHILDRLAVRAAPRGQAQTGKAQRVLCGPGDLQDRLVGQPVHGRGDGGEAYGLAVGGVGVAGRAGARAPHLLEQQQIAGRQVQRPCPSTPRRAHASRSVAEVAPLGSAHTSSPQVHKRMVLCSGRSASGSVGDDRLEDLHRAALVQHGQVAVVDDGADLGPVARAQACGRRRRRSGRCPGRSVSCPYGLDGDEGPGVDSRRASGSR